MPCACSARGSRRHVRAGLLRSDPSPSTAEVLPVGRHLRRAVSARAAAADRSVATVRGARVRDHPDDQSAQGVGAELARPLAGLCRALDGKSIAIVGLDRIERHWTVVYAATERTLRVADSSGLRVIFRSQCTVGRTSLRYQLRPSEVLTVRRERNT